MLDVGKGGFELTGLKDEDVIGRPVQEVLGLEWIDEGDGGETADTDGDGVTDPIETTLEWGVRSLGKRVAVNAEGDLPAEAVADVFPAYDDDGGLLLVLTPEWRTPRWATGAATTSSSSLVRPRPAGASRPRCIATKPTELGLDLKGGTELVYQGAPTPQDPTVDGDDIDRAIEIIRKRIDQLGVSEPEISRVGTDEIQVGLPDVTNASRATEQVGHDGAALLLRLRAERDRPEKAIGGIPARTADGARSDRRTRKSRPRRPKAEPQLSRRRLPDAYEAVKFASEQEPSRDCDNCTAPSRPTTSSTSQTRTS